MKTMTHTMSSTLALTEIITMLPTKACQKTRTMITHDNCQYHEYDLYHHAPNDGDYGKGITDVISDDEKENSGKNDN